MTDSAVISFFRTVHLESKRGFRVIKKIFSLIQCIVADTVTENRITDLILLPLSLFIYIRPEKKKQLNFSLIVGYVYIRSTAVSSNNFFACFVNVLTVITLVVILLATASPLLEEIRFFELSISFCTAQLSNNMLLPSLFCFIN